MNKDRNALAQNAQHSPQVVEVPADGRNREQLIADIAVEGVMSNAGTVVCFSSAQMGEGDITQAVNALRKNINASKAGDLSIADTLLIGQAAALNAIFHELARRAAMNAGSHLEALDTYMRLALKAQSQCRTTLESLAKIKNPPNVAFVKQANIAHGPQQVNNNAVSPASPARAEENANPPTELLEQDHAQWLDTGTASKASAGDPIMATVGTVHRGAHGARKGSGKP